MGITKTIKLSTTKLHFQAFINVFMLHENHQVCVITMGQSGSWQRDISRLGDFTLRIGLTVQNKASFPDVKCSPHAGQPPGTALFWRENVPNVKCHHLFSSKFLAFSTGKNLPNMEICLFTPFPPLRTCICLLRSQYLHCRITRCQINLHSCIPKSSGDTLW